jgi:hypothetical protein
VAAAICFGIDFAVLRAISRWSALGLLLWVVAGLVGQVHIA